MSQPRFLTRLKFHTPFILLLLIALPFLYIRLSEVPYTWYDEGLNLNASEELATTGQYGLPTYDGIRLSDPAIQSGLPLIVPLAVLYKLVGSNLLVMRVWMTLMGLLAFGALYGLVSRLYNRMTAVLVIAIILILPGDTTANFIMLSRQTLGEIPAILTIALGLWLMLAPAPRLPRLLAVGVLFGVAVILKSQALLILSVTLGLWLINLFRLGKKEEGTRWGIILVVMLGLYGVDTLWRSSMAGSAAAQNSEVLREGIFIHILTLRGLFNIITPSTLARFVIVSVIMGLFIVFRRRWSELSTTPERRHIESWLMLFVSLWICWYLFLSIGWSRYAFVGEIFSVVLGARLLTAFWQRRQWPTDRRMYAGLVGAVAVGACVLYIPPLRNTTGDKFFDMVNYLNENVPSDARIVTWEWPASYFTSHNYIFPTTHVVNVVTRSQSFSRSFPNNLFDPLTDCPDYVLLGSFIYDRTVFKPALELTDVNPVFSSGEYQLYRINPEKLNRLVNGSCAAKLTTQVTSSSNMDGMGRVSSS